MYPNRAFKPIANHINTLHNLENYWNAKNQFFTKSIHQDGTGETRIKLELINANDESNEAKETEKSYFLVGLLIKHINVLL